MRWTRETLQQHLESGASVDWLFFWGHTPKDPKAIDASCLSQWFPRAFELDGTSYPSAEHWMMASKARTFGDDAALERILCAPSPAEAKQLGREVTPFDAGKWSAVAYDLVVQGNVAKFSQHTDLKSFLLGTGEKVIVEAAPRDVVWGIGLGASNLDAHHPAKWRGKNLLGFALMEARAKLRG